MSVKQFSALYSQIEDRIFFSFNTSEGDLYQFLFTRGISKLLISQCASVAERSLGEQHGERSSKLISEFQKEGLKKHLSFDDHFEGGQKAPLGGEPILVSHIQLDLQGDVVHISLTLASNLVVGFELPVFQVQALCLLIEKLAKQAHWQIITDEMLSLGEENNSTTTPTNQIH